MLKPVLTCLMWIRKINIGRKKNNLISMVNTLVEISHAFLENWTYNLEHGESFSGNNLFVVLLLKIVYL